MSRHWWCRLQSHNNEDYHADRIPLTMTTIYTAIQKRLHNSTQSGRATPMIKYHIKYRKDNLYHNYTNRRWKALKTCHKALLIFSMLSTRTCHAVNILQHINIYNNLHSHMRMRVQEQLYKFILDVLATRKFTAFLFSKKLPFIS